MPTSSSGALSLHAFPSAVTPTHTKYRPSDHLMVTAGFAKHKCYMERPLDLVVNPKPPIRQNQSKEGIKEAKKGNKKQKKKSRKCNVRSNSAKHLVLRRSSPSPAGLWVGRAAACSRWARAAVEGGDLRVRLWGSGLGFRFS
jgi:hypothetical protein